MSTRQEIRVLCNIVGAILSSRCLARHLCSLWYSTCRCHCHCTTLNVLPWKRKNEFSFISLSCTRMSLSATYDTFRSPCNLQHRPTFFKSDFDRTRILSTDFDASPKYKIILKSVHWELRCSKRMDGLIIIIIIITFRQDI